MTCHGSSFKRNLGRTKKTTVFKTMKPALSSKKACLRSLITILETFPTLMKAGTNYFAVAVKRTVRPNASSYTKRTSRISRV